MLHKYIIIGNKVNKENKASPSTELKKYKSNVTLNYHKEWFSKLNCNTKSGKKKTVGKPTKLVI